MAKYIAIIVSLIFLIFSVNSVVHGQKTEDPSEEIIKNEDAEEGYNFLQLKDIEDNIDNEKKSKPVQDDLPIYPLQDKEPDVTDTSKTIAEPAKQETKQTDNKDDEVQILDDPESNEEQETIVSRDVNEPEKTEHSLPEEETEIHEDETNSEPKNTYDEVAAKNEITDTYGNKDNINNLEIDTYGPEEDLDGTFHENYIENRDNEESNNGDMNDKNDEIVVPSEWEENEEFTNAVSGSESNPDFVEIYDEVINNHDNEPTEYEDSFMENDNLDRNNEDEISVQTTEIENQSEEDGESLENETEEDFSEPKTSLEEESYHAFPEKEENTVEESENLKNSETEDLHNISDEDTENLQINGEVGEQEETEEENEGNEEAESEEENKSATEVGMNEEEEEEESKEDIETEIGEEEETENEEEEEQTDGENQNEELQEIEEAESNEEIEPENEEELEEEQQNNEESVEEEEEEEKSGENIKLENDEENEEETEDEEESNLFDEVHPLLQPPSIKQPSIIYAALQESYMFDKEENEEETEESNSDSLVFGEVEAPGSLLDIQMAPVEASKEQTRTSETDCSLPAETGPCRAYFRRFFFNSNSRECDVFVYGGCQGNGNNFKTLDDCVNTCVKKIVNL